MSRYAYSLPEMTARLMKMAAPIRKELVISTAASLFGNLGRMGLMGFGALYIMRGTGLISPSFPYLAGMAVCGILIALCRYLEGVYSHLGAYGVLAGLRIDLYDMISRAAPEILVERKTGELLNIAVGDIETLEFFFAHTIGPMFTVILLPVITVIIAFRNDPLYGWLLIPVYILISVVIPFAAFYAGRDTGRRYREDLAELKALILECVTGIRDIQIFSKVKESTDKAADRNRRVTQSARGLIMHREILNAVPDFFVYISRILIIAAAGYLYAKGTADIPKTVALSFIAAASLSSTFSLTFVVTHLLEAFAAAERIFIIEDTIPSVSDTGKTHIDEFENIELSDVSFSYKGGQKVLDRLDLTIRKGEHIGLYGESGEGKSTILRLLLRFYDPDTGCIRMNGCDLKEIPLADLHRHIALLEQDTYLFDASIRDNIAFSDLSAPIEKVKEAAEKAGIAGFIETLPEGYDTQMGMMSARLSGGERQRIGIARILMSDASFIIMDEPSSSLDVMHEKELLHTLHTACAEKTILLISHRMSTISWCDRLLELKNGSLKEKKQDDLLGEQ